MIDTHAHLHFEEFHDDLAEVTQRALDSGITDIICVGVDEVDSARAITFVGDKPHLFCSAGLHPHAASHGRQALDMIATMATSEQVVAVGECGLDYHKNLSPVDDQDKALRFQIELARRLDKPLIFHVRDAWQPFFDILDSFPDVTGVVHSFSASPKEVEEALKRGLYIGLNGIMTFTKNPDQLKAAQKVPLNRLLLETDAPFLSPPPYRGKRNEPAFLIEITRFLAGLRGEDPGELVLTTTANAQKLFGIS